MSNDSFVRSVRRVEARQAIGDLLADYCYALDRGLESMFRSLWLADGVWQFDPPLGRYAGIDTIMEAWRQIRAQTANVHHLTADIRVIELTDDQARVRSNGLAQSAPAGQRGGAIMFVHFEDVLQRTDEGWQFASRFVHFYGDAVVDVQAGSG